MNRDKPHHSATVPIEAHVPGPGRSRPMPKNVAIISAYGLPLETSPGPLSSIPSLSSVNGDEIT